MKQVTGTINFNTELKGIEWAIKSHLTKTELKFLQSDKVGLGYNRKTGKFYVGMRQAKTVERLYSVYKWMVDHCEGAALDDKTFKKVFGSALKQPALATGLPSEAKKPDYSKMKKAELIALLESLNVE